MTNSKAWTDEENRAVVALYFAMLDRASAGKTYIKRVMIRNAQSHGVNGCPDMNAAYFGKLSDRSKGSIEFKLMNCSAAHAALDPTAETMHGYGYRALPNYQSTLRDAMSDKLETRRRCYIGSDGKRYA